MDITDPKVLTVPFQHVISGGFTPGKKITIEGTVHPGAESFSVGVHAGSVIALQYKPHFNDNVVVRNSNHPDTWGQEERGGPMPFMRGHVFSMRIQCEPEFFKIMVNGAEAHRFNHRYKHFCQISSIHIEGAVSLSFIAF